MSCLQIRLVGQKGQGRTGWVVAKVLGAYLGAMRQTVCALAAVMLALAGCDAVQTGKPVAAPAAAVPVSTAPLGVGKSAAALDLSLIHI